MPNEIYRFYCLDGTGQLHDVEEIKAGSDEDAVAQVAAKHPNAKWELWQERRLVAKSNPYAATNILDASRRRRAEAHRTLKDTATLVERPARFQRGQDAR